MADAIHSLMRYAHIGFGFLGLAAFWVPVAAKKGAKLHVRCGKIFALSAYVVALSALGSCLWLLTHPASWMGRPVSLADLPPNAVMFMALLAVLATFLLKDLETGIAVLRTRKQPQKLGSLRLRSVYWLHGIGSAALLGFGAFQLARGEGALFWVAVGVGLVGLSDSRDAWRFLANPRPTPMAWWYKHMQSMIGTGVAFHTAFLVFGSRIFFDLSAMGSYWSFIPWILPAAIAIPSLHFWVRSYKRKFGELPDKASVQRAEA